VKQYTTVMKAVAVMLPWALQGLEPHGQLLELGSGSAAMAAGTAARYPQVQVTATDLDPVMVQAAAARLARYSPADRLGAGRPPGLYYGDSGGSACMCCGACAPAGCAREQWPGRGPGRC
jgi:hypothetical protein